MVVRLLQTPIWSFGIQGFADASKELTKRVRCPGKVHKLEPQWSSLDRRWCLLNFFHGGNHPTGRAGRVGVRDLVHVRALTTVRREVTK